MFDEFIRGKGALAHKKVSETSGVTLVALPGSSDGLAAVESFRTSPLVASAQPNFVYSAAFAPNDPSYSSGQAWYLDRISAPAAWDIIRNASVVLVAVLDTGINLEHEDFVRAGGLSNIWTNPGEAPYGYNGVDNDGNGYVDDINGETFVGINAPNNDTHDRFGHGSHVAGTLGVAGNNGVGVAGIIWRGNLLPIKVLGDNGKGSSVSLVSGLDYAVGRGAQVCNLSLGQPNYDQSLQDAVQRARNAGVILVCAAGNGSPPPANGGGGVPPPGRPVSPFNDCGSSVQGANLDASGANYPASFPDDNIVSVAATNENDELAGFSNYGPFTVDLAAPGTNIYSLWVPGNSYHYDCGTSMATPMVTGALALMKAKHPDWSYQQLINTLLNNVDYLPSLQGKVRSNGRLNLYRALLP